MYWILGVLVFLAWGLERYFKFFSRFAKGVNSGVVSAVLLAVFILVVVAEFANGNWLRAVFLIALAAIAVVNFTIGKKKQADE